MPFLKAEGACVFEFPSGILRGTRWRVAVQTCNSVTCGCRALEIGMLPASSAGQRDSDERRLWIDLNTRQLAEPSEKEGEEEGEEEDRLFGEVFVAQFGPGEWEVLEGTFARLKKELYERTNLKEAEYEFQIDEIENEGLLVPYNDVLPFHNVPVVEVEGRTYLVVDYYALARACRGHGPLVVFGEPTGGWESGPREYVENFSIEVDPDRGKWQIGETMARTAVPPERIVTAFFRQFGFGFLAERQRTLRAMYRWNHGKELGPVAAPTRVGRNDPCPCGSGKKYKKCCGR